MKKLHVLSTILALSLTPLASAAQDAVELEPSGDTLVQEHIHTLETMISMWPKQEYYLQLASLYGRVDDFERQLTLYEIAKAMGWLTETSQFIELARLLLRADRVEEADETLQKALEIELRKARRDDE